MIGLSSTRISVASMAAYSRYRSFRNSVACSPLLHINWRIGWKNNLRGEDRIVLRKTHSNLSIVALTNCLLHRAWRNLQQLPLVTGAVNVTATHLQNNNLTLEWQAHISAVTTLRPRMGSGLRPEWWKKQLTDCGPDRSFCSNKSTWVDYWLLIKPSRQLRWSGLNSCRWKEMGFLQRKWHIDWLQLSRPPNQNDRVSAEANKIKQMIGWLLAWLKIWNNDLILKLRHYWLELSIPEWVSLVWSMRGLLSLILCCRGISFEDGYIQRGEVTNQS